MAFRWILRGCSILIGSLGLSFDFPRIFVSHVLARTFIGFSSGFRLSFVRLDFHGIFLGVSILIGPLGLSFGFSLTFSTFLYSFVIIEARLCRHHGF